MIELRRWPQALKKCGEGRGNLDVLATLNIDPRHRWNITVSIIQSDPPMAVRQMYSASA
jgi:hypothetical protein